MPETADGTVYSRTGSGKPLVLVHGIGSRKEVWDPIVDRLAAQRDVIAVDLPGFGASPSMGASGVEPLIDRVENLIKELGLDRPDVGGSSMGGGIALELARRGVAGRAVAFSPIGFWNTPERLLAQGMLITVRQAVRRLGEQMIKYADTTVVRSALAGFYGHPSRVTIAQRRGDVEGLVAATDFEDVLRSFSTYNFSAGEELAKVPVVIAWGSRDVLLIHRTQSARAKRALPHADHVTIPGAGHLPFSDEPDICARILLRE
ncbi:alpha/beta fold hydrolase [Antrihabitans sp. YC2-6]|uniref:alpha/beta fold hydrolase n=1 Tax=Antrihabitans sp. YC2-6 TaxID=2799498 RepID=UPI0018F40C79|nr:alpha/beta hydrolase [Antrihabitans sp. YC2-6]MBJ8347527.1 alpha/beta hydrolase [Antrihabitans sp. YC2-6]